MLIQGYKHGTRINSPFEIPHSKFPGRYNYRQVRSSLEYPILRTRFFAISLAASALALSGCGHHEASTTSTNTLHRPMNDSPTTFDPSMVQDGMTIDMLQQVFEGLVMWTPENKVAPALAESWDVSKDGLTYTFHLRQGVKFQDGNPMTSADVVYSFTRSLSPTLKSPVALTYLGDIVGSDDVYNGKATVLAGVKAVDPSTVAITIKKPKAYWIYTLTYPTAYVVSRAEADKAGGEMKATDIATGAGTGAFKFVSYTPDQNVELTSNPGYWGGAPHIDGQELLIVRDAGTRHSLYESGKLDIVDESVADSQADSANADMAKQIKYWKRAATWYINLNEKTVAAFKDVRVRQALAYATDKATIAKVSYGGHVDVAEDILPEGIPGYDPSFKGIPYDPAKGRALLAAAGYPGGKGFPALKLNYRQSDPAIESAADKIRQMWSDNLGISVQPQRTQWGVLLDMENKGTLESWYIRWSADYLDPQDYYSVLLHTGVTENHAGYSNPKFDALCDAADIDTDATRRAATYRQAARIAADEVPVIPLLYQTDTELVKPNVQGIDDSLMGHLPYKHVTLK